MQKKTTFTKSLRQKQAYDCSSIGCSSQNVHTVSANECNQRSEVVNCSPSVEKNEI